MILEIPSGSKCLGCMFLGIDYSHNNAKCLLFKEDLDCSMAYGHVEESGISKGYSCCLVKDNHIFGD